MVKEFDVYSVMAIAFGVVACVGAAIFGVSRFLTSRGPASTAPTVVRHARPPTGAILGRRLHIRFTAPMVMSVLLITLALLMIPCSGWLGIKNDTEARLRWLIVMLTLSFSALFSVLYCTHKGDLSWERE